MTFKTGLGMGGSIAVLSHGEWYSAVPVQNRALPRVDSSVRGVWVSLRESAYMLLSNPMVGWLGGTTRYPSPGQIDMLPG